MMKRIFYSLLMAGLLASCSNKIKPVIAGAASADKNIRVLSYNIHHCNPPSKEGLIDVDAIVKAIRLQNPDLVALQEVPTIDFRAPAT